MQKHIKKDPVIRVIDANINRGKEGLRVCEEITRFLLEDSKLTGELKNARHAIDPLVRSLVNKKYLLECRYSLKDVGFSILGKELRRGNVQDIFLANIQRAKESVRVLEEFSKLINKHSALGFKKLRYRIYEIEKKAVKEVAALSDIR